ncbi:MAG: 30S ribosome-binding factor RbfA [Bacilli bacterium]|nr:30S ribosome-binding factor RbfA [Bacilli bacterium]MDD4282877.1 30S ribosome-binding factor RbfA [Bacilli bacterium]MDD4718309.1 30S ribosome-binding factor RbfA [Bacilli bacterium]
MSLKINRLANILIQEISYILATEVKDKNIKFVTVTDVKLTNDLSFAKVYVTVLDDEKREETMKSLNNAKGFIRTKLTDRVDMRHVPKISFVYDESIEYGNKIENLIGKLNKENKN